MIQAQLSHTTEFLRLSAAAQTPGACALFGLPPSGRAVMYAALAEQLQRTLCVVTPGEAEATRFAEDLSALGVPAAVFPYRDYLLRTIDGTGRESEYRRLSVLGGLVSGRLKAVCLSAEALLQFTVPRDEFCTNTMTLRPGQSIPRDTLLQKLFDAGYVRRPQVDGPGQFSLRGDILDLYAPDMRRPARIEFWDDEIDTIAAFDLVSQRRDKNLSKVYLSPAREVLFGSTSATLAALRAALDETPARKRTRMEACMQNDLSLLEADIMPEAMDKYLGIRYPKPATLLDYFTSDSVLLVLDQPADLREAQRATQMRRNTELEGLLADKVICPGLDVFYETEDYLLAACDRFSTVCAENFMRSMPDIRLKELVDAPAHQLPGWGGDVANLLDELEPLLQQGFSAVCMAGTPQAADALAADLKAKRLTVVREGEPAPGTVLVRTGHLTAGCSFPFAKAAVFSSRRHGLEETDTPAPKKRRKDAYTSLDDIHNGDYVVHQDYGIGVYEGIQRMRDAGAVKDYLVIRYANNDTLYVPVTQLDQLSRYTAAADGDIKVKINRLGGTEWTKTRKKVHKAAEEMAKELVELYARRRKAQGHAFPPDDSLQTDFENRFEYEETGDQLRSAEEIKRDMEKPNPMDRLLCGDVGVGKTEVALRAAFKCIASGKQCAILAPTTLLAWQHFNTILSRFEPYGFRVGLLNRFRSAKQQKQTLYELSTGKIELIVGTHRLLSKDVHFKDLGLVIVDEEQRFGVKQKERLKEAFIGVDILSMSATPIPRTLSMALNGIRDMSTIEEPPIERRPVETYVLEYDGRIIAEAIRKELARGGQVYYLHNRVGDIESTAEKIRQLVPQARIDVAHGQMDEATLNGVWQRLLNNEIDVLICTTLIETGVDVRNCNTLIIEDADYMGLAQLYQIRGRVGRSGRKAYAYFTFHRDKVLSDDAAKRLSAIREFTNFGSGFRIAMRDLQIRGAGNLLGHSQSGHIESVGYDLYVKLLNQAIRAAKGEAPRLDKSDCRIAIKVDAFLPENYITQLSGRIEAYKRIAGILNAEDAQDVIDELVDRYGDPPKSVESLVAVSLARVTAAAAGVTDVRQAGNDLVLTLERLAPAAGARVQKGLPDNRVQVGAAPNPSLSIRLRPGDRPLELLNRALALLQAPAAEKKSS